MAKGSRPLLFVDVEFSRRRSVAAAVPAVPAAAAAVVPAVVATTGSSASLLTLRVNENDVSTGGSTGGYGWIVEAVVRIVDVLGLFWICDLRRGDVVYACGGGCTPPPPPIASPLYPFGSVSRICCGAADIPTPAAVGQSRWIGEVSCFSASPCMLPFSVYREPSLLLPGEVDVRVD